MAAERLFMRTIKEVIRLKWEKKLSNKHVAQTNRDRRNGAT